MEQKYINSWANYTSWQDVTPPSRPAKWQLKTIRSVIQKYARNKAVAVLGSTIEYRDLLSELGFNNVFVFERNMAFFNYITPFAKTSLNERVVEGDWLETLPLYKNYFYIILSDLTSGNIPYDLRDSFYRSISEALTVDGLYIDRILTNAAPYYELDYLLKKYSHKKITNHSINTFNCEMLFCSTLLNNKTVVDSSKIYDQLLSLNNDHISSFVYACYNITPRDCMWWYGNSWDRERLRYKQYFTILNTMDEPVNSPYYKHASLIISRKYNRITE